MRYHYLDPGSFRVNDTYSCQLYFVNETRVIMRIPLFGRCGAEVSDYADMLQFSSVVQAEVYWSPSGITRYPDHIFLFKCLYFRTATLSLTSFTPDGKIVRRPPGKSAKSGLSLLSLSLTLGRQAIYRNKLTQGGGVIWTFAPPPPTFSKWLHIKNQALSCKQLWVSYLLS